MRDIKTLKVLRHTPAGSHHNRIICNAMVSLNQGPNT